MFIYSTALHWQKIMNHVASAENIIYRELNQPNCLTFLAVISIEKKKKKMMKRKKEHPGLYIWHLSEITKCGISAYYLSRLVGSLL